MIYPLVLIWPINIQIFISFYTDNLNVEINPEKLSLRSWDNEEEGGTKYTDTW